MRIKTPAAMSHGMALLPVVVVRVPELIAVPPAVVLAPPNRLVNQFPPAAEVGVLPDAGDPATISVVEVAGELP
jgi:hypothetical protein